MKQSYNAKNIILKCATDFLLPIIMVLGFYVIIHGHLTPGGGFQGGVIVAAAVALIYLGYGIDGLNKSFKWNALKQTENIGALMYIAFAFLGILGGANFCKNILFNNGNPGDLYSSGTIFWMNFSVGLKVMAGISFMLIIMLSSLKDNNE